MIEFAGGIFVGVLISFIVFQYVRSRERETVSKQIEHSLQRVFPQVLQNANEQLITLADQKLKAEKQDIHTDLHNKKSIIEDMVKHLREEMEKNSESLRKAETERVGSFSQLKQELEQQRVLTDQLMNTTKALRNVLSNNQMRGQFGEQVAEDLLKMAGFTHGIDYEMNKQQDTQRTRPDFTIFMPNGVKINVDSKFPYQSLVLMSETDDKAMKAKYAKDFERDVKQKIKQIITRDYINPEENTVDFVVLFIPNEIVFSYVYDKFHDTWHEAMKQKVIFAGPFSFTAILRMVRQAYDYYRYQSNIRTIIQHISQFETEYQRYSEEFKKIGDRIDSLQKQYQVVDTTRTKQLTRIVERIKLEQELPQASPTTETRRLLD